MALRMAGRGHHESFNPSKTFGGRRRGRLEAHRLHKAWKHNFIISRLLYAGKCQTPTADTISWNDIQQHCACRGAGTVALNGISARYFASEYQIVRRRPAIRQERG